MQRKKDEHSQITLKTTLHGWQWSDLMSAWILKNGGLTMVEGFPDSDISLELSVPSQSSQLSLLKT